MIAEMPIMANFLRFCISLKFYFSVYTLAILPFDNKCLGEGSAQVLAGIALGLAIGFKVAAGGVFKPPALLILFNLFSSLESG